MGQPKSEVWKAKARESWTPERKAAASARMTNNCRNPKGREPGFTQTNETRQKLSESRTGLIVRKDGLSCNSVEARRQSKLKHRYRMSPEEYNTLLAKQDGHCALCPAVIGYQGHALGVDHDHACCPTNKTCGKCRRGLLCDDCNNILGKVEDKGVNWIESVKAYILRYKLLLPENPIS